MKKLLYLFICFVFHTILIKESMTGKTQALNVVTEK